MTDYTMARRPPAEVNGDRLVKQLTKRELLAGLILQGLISDPNSEINDAITCAVVAADRLLSKLEGGDTR